MKIFGVNAWEMVALILLLGAAYFGEQYGLRFGRVFAIVGMVLFPIALLLFVQLLAWLEREFLLGQKPYPRCRCGEGPIDELPEKNLGSRMVHSCECGRSYAVRYVGRLMLIEESGESEFARWKPFRGWRPESSR